MSETRRRLGSLASEVNIGGEEALRRRVGPEQSPVQRHTIRMYERREEAWRPLNKYSVAAFLRLFFLCFRGSREWSPTPPSDVQDAAKGPDYPHHPIHLSADSSDHG